MKKSILTLIVICISAIQILGQTENLSMGPGYANDIYYSFENGTIKEITRNNWDIAFYTPKFSAGVMINEGNGVTLYTYPSGDTADWALVDTAGMVAWQPIYNSPTVWEDGAFNVNATGHPDYGWGTYNMATHNLTGDSIYVIQLADGSFKKLWIVGKQSLANIYTIRYADLDGADEINEDIAVAPYENKRFYYYSLVNNEELDRDPESETWDILFTKYMDLTKDNDGNWVPYLVTGATSNVDIGANEFYPVPDDFNSWAEMPFDSAKNVIGYDWKSFDMGTFTWEIADSTAFFVQSYNGDVYKLTFESWEGSTTGNFVINKSMVSLASVDELKTEIGKLTAYPNPAASFVNIKISEEASYDSMIIMNQSGKIIYQSDVSQIDLRNGYKIDLNGFTKGLYIIQLNGNNIQTNQKLLVR
ncbi:MAG: hypothetical protein C0591_10920 [Marinilabiliales bacterium]|nr:MAG: hypothetical protein C0591_10920 [Marinilabiliales bacterium]